MINRIKVLLALINVKRQNFPLKDKREWIRTFVNFLDKINSSNWDYSERWELLNGFCDNNLHMVKKAKILHDKSVPYLICVIRNEEERLPVFLGHYRKMGIKEFAIVDNSSSDRGTEYLKMQSDTTLFICSTKFSSRRKTGWTNRIISYYGKENWFLVVDADELLVWNGYPQYTLSDIVKKLENEMIYRCRGLMIDMYGNTAEREDANENIYHGLAFFDTDTYYRKADKEVYLLCGGPRKRKLDVEVWLTKYPLFKLKKYDLMSNPHTIFPFKGNFLCKYCVCLLHYKFVTKNDYRKMRKYTREGVYVGGSFEYEKYLEVSRGKKINFYYDKSSYMESCGDLAKIKWISDWRNME